MLQMRHKICVVRELQVLAGVLLPCPLLLIAGHAGQRRSTLIRLVRSPEHLRLTIGVRVRNEIRVRVLEPGLTALRPVAGHRSSEGCCSLRSYRHTDSTLRVYIPLAGQLERSSRQVGYACHTRKATRGSKQDFQVGTG